MRWLTIICALAGTPAIAQDEPGFLERLFGTDSANSDVEQGSLLESLIEDSLSDAGRVVTVTGFQGALSGAATLKSLTIEDADGVWLTLNDASLDWNRAALFRGQLEVTELLAGEILLPRLSAPEDAEALSPEARSFQLPDLPVSVEIGRIAAERVELGEELFGIAAEISVDGSFSLADGGGAAKLEISRLDQPGQIALDTSFDNSTNVLALDLTMIEDQGGILATLAGLPGAPPVDFTIGGNAPLSEFKADIRLATDATERLSGQVIVSQTQDARRIDADISGDIAPIFAPQYRDFFGENLSLEAEVFVFDDGRIALPEFSLFARELALFGAIELGSDRVPEIIDITGRIAPESGTRVRLPIAGAAAEIAHANLAITFDASESDDLRGVIRLAELTRDGLTVEEMTLRGAGQIGAGNATDFKGDLSFDVTGLQTDDGVSDAIGSDIQGIATIEWIDGPLSIDDFSLKTGELEMSGSASVEGSLISADTSFNAARLSPFSKLAARQLGGQANLNLSGQIDLVSQAFEVKVEGETEDLTIDEPRADAVLSGRAKLEATAVRDTDGMRIVLTTLESPAANLTGEASLRSGGSSAALSGRLNETSLVLPGLNGPSEITFGGQESETRDWTIATTLTAPALSAKVNGTFSNIYDLPAFQGTVSANSPDLSAFSETAGRTLSGSLSVRAEGGANADLSRALVDATLRGRDISVEGLGLDRILKGAVTLEIEGSRTEDRLDIVNLAFGAESLIAQFSGTLTDLSSTPSFDGRVTASAPDLAVFSRLANRPLGGQLNVAANGRTSADLSTVELDAKADGQNLSIGVTEVDRLLSGPIAFKIDAARNGDRFLISEFKFDTNELQAATSGQLGADGDRLRVNARLRNLSAFVPGFSGALRLDGSVGYQGSDFSLDIDADGPGGARATIAGTVAQNISFANLTIDGTAPLGLANRFIAPRSIAGVSRFALRLNGRPVLNSLAGRILLSNARLATPNLPTNLEDISGTIDLTNGQATLNIDGRVESGGTLSVSGPIGLAPPYSAALQTAVSQVRIADPRLFETVANGTLQIAGPLTGGASIAGTINLGETNIRIPSSGLGGSGAIPEIVHLNEPPPVRGTRRKAGLLDRMRENGSRGGSAFPLDIRLLAPNRIFLRGRGLDSEFGGSLSVTGTTTSIVPIGAFDLIRGRLDILGQRLSLEQARITLQGGLIPVLDILASTETDDTSINVEVLGRADRPEIRFTSSPELPQEEVLARLIFGRGLETLSPIQAARLALAVRTLAGQGGEGIVGNIRGTAGLADLDVTTNEDGNAAVRAGAYLGENIYSDVTVDSAGETQLNLNLDVTPSLTVRGGVTNDGSSSLGIFFERDY